MKFNLLEHLMVLLALLNTVCDLVILLIDEGDSIEEREIWGI